MKIKMGDNIAAKYVAAKVSKKISEKIDVSAEYNVKTGVTTTKFFGKKEEHRGILAKIAQERADYQKVLDKIDASY